MVLIKDLGTARNNSGTFVRTGMYLCEKCNMQFKLFTHNVKKRKSQFCAKCTTTERNTRHGLSHNKSYKIYRGMMGRCYRKDSIQYKNYGGRGITICDEWQDPVVFDKWFNEHYIEGYQIDRIDNDGNYEPSNCRFVTPSDNIKNNRFALDIQSKEPYVVWDTKKGMWRVSIPPNKKRKQPKRIYLGMFKSEQEAIMRKKEYFDNCLDGLYEGSVSIHEGLFHIEGEQDG